MQVPTDLSETYHPFVKYSSPQLTVSFRLASNSTLSLISIFPMATAAPNTPQARPYDPEDLEGLKKDALVELVLAQKECWPLNESGRNVTATQIRRDTPVADLRNALLSRDYGFTTTQPPRTTTATTQPSATPNVIATLAPSPSQPALSSSLVTGGDGVFLSVFVQDLRVSAESKGEVATFSVPCSMEIGNTEVGTRVPLHISALDVMRELQKSNAAIKGKETVTISQQHAMYTGYQVTFAASFDPQSPEAAVYSPQLLQYPPKGHLFLAITSKASVQQNSSAQGQDVPKGHDIASKREASEGTRKQIVEWLQERLGEMDTYVRFKRNRRRVLQNPEIVEQWAFMYKFSEEYRGKRAVLAQRRLRITQRELAKALGYSRSTLKAALAAYEIVKDCGVGGKRESEAVVNEIERTEDPQNGAQELIKFLQPFAA
ncbi:hypothetical protein V5O48_007250 [Marasmius crinis-equi]|uniref:HTH cro/C1-type domain-containing protein n=1 Tax=Marasmius crinis-equi TaxID=585013 RepID=A0ABR3FI06_9AGAR